MWLSEMNEKAQFTSFFRSWASNRTFGLRVENQLAVLIFNLIESVRKNNHQEIMNFNNGFVD